LQQRCLFRPRLKEGQALLFRIDGLGTGPVSVSCFTPHQSLQWAVCSRRQLQYSLSQRLCIRPLFGSRAAGGRALVKGLHGCVPAFLFRHATSRHHPPPPSFPRWDRGCREWNDALQAASRFKLPKRRTADTAPDGLGVGWNVQCPGARNTGGEDLYQVGRARCRRVCTQLAKLPSCLFPRVRGGCCLLTDSPCEHYTRRAPTPTGGCPVFPPRRGVPLCAHPRYLHGPQRPSRTACGGGALAAGGCEVPHIAGTYFSHSAPSLSHSALSLCAPFVSLLSTTRLAWLSTVHLASPLH